MTESSDSSLASRPLQSFLDDVAAKTSAPGGGAVAAIAVALAASLCAMAARYSETALADALSVASRCDELAARALTLATADAHAYEAVLEVRRLRRSQGGEAIATDADLAAALLAASDVPLEVADLGAEVTELAAGLLARGNPNLAGDAFAGAQLAQGATRAAARLAEINLASCGPAAEGRHERALAAVGRAAAASD
ncbi:MAG: cyclodeaminase/cyclohydrolase family protein [Acidimicrobiales bacterium]